MKKGYKNKLNKIKWNKMVTFPPKGPKGTYLKREKER